MITEAVQNQLIEKLKQFKNSSIFKSGDAGAFSINFGSKLDLPGKCNPKTYIENLKLPKLGKTCIVFPGNGGLCIEALKLGAEVYAVEPRILYTKALTEVSILSLTVLNKTFSREGSISATGLKFDTIIWPEGLEQLPNPFSLLKEAYNALSDDGLFIIEITHGEQKVPDNWSKCVSWRPKEAIFTEFLSTIFPGIHVEQSKGRLDRRIIYKIAKPIVKIADLEKNHTVVSIDDVNFSRKTDEIKPSELHEATSSRIQDSTNSQSGITGQGAKATGEIPVEIKPDKVRKILKKKEIANG